MPSRRSRGWRPGVLAGGRGGGTRGCYWLSCVGGGSSEPIARRCSALCVHRRPARRPAPARPATPAAATRCAPARQFTAPGAEFIALRGQNSPPRCQFFNVCNGWPKCAARCPLCTYRAALWCRWDVGHPPWSAPPKRRAAPRPPRRRRAPRAGVDSVESRRLRPLLFLVDTW